jgi:diguanylate cyclase (GGDEF)-like protein/PAS domain S-box-containing protein
MTIFLFSYVYINKSKELFTSQTYSQLQSVTDLRHYELSSYFEHLVLDMEAMSKGKCFEELVKDVNSFKSSEFNKENLYKISKKYSYELAYMNNFVNHHEYSDIFLMKADSYSIFYTMNSPELLTQSIQSKKLSVILSKVVEQSKTYIVDMYTFDLKKYERPTLAIATPVIDNEKVVAIMLLVIPNSDINNMIKYRTGMGKTGETYMVGQDKYLRSDSYLDKELRVDRHRDKDSLKEIDTVATKKALAGESGMGIIKDYRGTEVLSVYRPFEFKNIKWALISEIDVKEIDAHFENIRNNILYISGLLSLALTLFGYLTLRYIIDNTVLYPLKRSYSKAKEFQDIVENSLNEIFIFDVDTLKFIYANQGAQKNIGYSFEEMLDMTPIDIKPRIDKKVFLEIVSPLISGEKEQITFETIHMRKDGSTYDVDIRLQLMQFKNKKYFVAFINDISERNNALRQKELYYERSTHDYLTQIYNRQYFDELFDIEVERAKRYKHPISLILFDIDDFKAINDKHGHDFGDKVLIKISNLVKNMLRDSDVFARWGGEEFIILMPHTNLEQAKNKADQIRLVLSELEMDGLGKITCSFGVMQINDLINANTAFSYVDKALFKAKENGKNRVEEAESLD